MLFNKFRLNGYFNKSRKGLDPLPKTNLISNIFMKNGELIDKLGNEPPKVLYPCFKGDGTKKIQFSGNIGTNFSISFDCMDLDNTEHIAILSGGAWGGKMPLYISDDNSLRFYPHSTHHAYWNGLDVQNISSFRLKRNGADVSLFINGGDAIPPDENDIEEADTTTFNYLFLRSTSSDAFGVKGQIWNFKINDIHFPLTGHAYGFTPSGFVEGTPSDDSCFEGLTEWNPQEGYNEGLECLTDAYISRQSTTVPAELIWYVQKKGYEHDIVFCSDENNDFRTNSIIFLRTDAVTYIWIYKDGVRVVKKQQSAILPPDDCWYKVTTTSTSVTVSALISNVWTVLHTSSHADLPYVFSKSKYQSFIIDAHDKIPSITVDGVNISVNQYKEITGTVKIDYIPQSRETGKDNEDINGAELISFLGGDAISPYCILDYENVDNAVLKEIMNRDNNSINNGDFNAFEEITGKPYQWRVETLLRLPEFIRSLQDTWHIFLKKRASDEALEQMVAYISAKNDITLDATDEDDMESEFKVINITGGIYG